MDLKDFSDNGGYAYVVGLKYSVPPRYAAFRAESPSGWMWTDDITEAESFRTRWEAYAHLKGDMAALVDGNGDVTVIKVEMKTTAVLLDRPR